MLDVPAVCSQDLCIYGCILFVGVQGNLVALRGLPSHPTALLASPIADL